MKRFITSDWHLGDDRMAMLQRPFQNSREMIEILIKNHNQIVSKDDLVYLVGDVCYKESPQSLIEVERFNGRKILIRGNHDKIFTDNQLLDYFQEVIPEKGLQLNIGDIACNITHYPSLAVADRFNLVGHVHSAWKYQLNSVNIGIDTNHFVPHNLDESVPLFLKSIEMFDEDVWAAYNLSNNQYTGIRGREGSYFNTSKLE